MLRDIYPVIRDYKRSAVFVNSLTMPVFEDDFEAITLSAVEHFGTVDHIPENPISLLGGGTVEDRSDTMSEESVPELSSTGN